jgi:hypothetical protein
MLGGQLLLGEMGVCAGHHAHGETCPASCTCGHERFEGDDVGRRRLLPIVDPLRPAEAFADPAHRKQNLGTKDHVDLAPLNWFKKDAKGLDTVVSSTS